MNARVISKFSWRSKTYLPNDPIVVDDQAVFDRMVREGFIQAVDETAVEDKPTAPEESPAAQEKSEATEVTPSAPRNEGAAASVHKKKSSKKSSRRKL